MDPGQTKELALGTTGRTVIGSVQFQREEPVNWRGALGSLISQTQMESKNATYVSPTDFFVNSDGTFQVDSVQPGRYTLKIIASKPQTAPEKPPEQIGALSYPLEIPDEPSEEMIQLGELIVPST